MDLFFNIFEANFEFFKNIYENLLTGGDAPRAIIRLDQIKYSRNFRPEAEAENYFFSLKKVHEFLNAFQIL